MKHLDSVRLLALVGILCITISGITSAGAADEEVRDVEEQRAEYRLAMNAKLLCSGVFVIGRDAEEFIANDLQYHGLSGEDWDKIEVIVDRERKSVTLMAPGVRSRTALFNGDQGCTLLPAGEDRVSFEPHAVTSSLPDPMTQDWPMGDRLETGPLPAEVDGGSLASALDFAFDDANHARPQMTRAIVVLYKGRLIAERYAPGFDKDTRHISWSMGKSITSALIGILVGQGEFQVDDPAPIAQWRSAGDPRGSITVGHLLHMSSGLKFERGSAANRLSYTDGDNHTFVYFGATDVFKYSVGNELEFPPDTVWRYRNCDPLALGKIIRDAVQARGEDYLGFPQKALFDRIGMRNMVLETDPYGNFIMTGFDYGTARDWARLGLLHLQGGLWQGERVLPEGWVDYIRTPAPASSNQGYGGLFWLNAGKRHESLPEDAYWPAGHHGQVVMIIPSRDMVVVRLGHSARGGFDPYIEETVRRILDCVDPAQGS